jgi:hypothetical protein
VRHSFPTRRSSDLLQEKNLQHIQDNEGLAMVVNEDNLVAFQNFLDEMGKWK